MKHLKERYIYDVTRRLKENQRVEVSKELNANIRDMMVDDSDAELERVLRELGEPRVLASEYHEKKRYLISPKWMDDYIRVLKVVIAVFVSLSLVFGLIDNILNPEGTGAIEIIFEVFGKTISQMIDAAVSAFAIVTLVFALIERYDLNPKKKPWDFNNLPELPKKDVLKISRTGAMIGFVFTLIFGVAFSYFLFHHQTYLRLIVLDGDVNFSEYLFADGAISAYIPFFIASIVVSLVVSLFKIKEGYLSLKIVCLHTIKEGFSLAVFLYFIHLSPLFNPDFINQIALNTPFTITEIYDGINQGINFLTVLIPIFVGLDILSTWVKYLKHQHQLKNAVSK